MALLPGLLAVAGCHSYHIDCTIENRTGAAVRLLEVDYPSASFGTDNVAAGADFHYRFVVLDSGPIKVQYTAANGQQVQLTGPTLDEHQQGRFEIVLLPGGRAEFHPELTRPS
jgi:hypothetical protein